MKDQSKKNLIIICYSTLLAIMPIIIISIMPLFKQKINAYADSLWISNTGILNIDPFLYPNYVNYFSGLLTGFLAGIILFFIIRNISSYASLPAMIGCVIGILFSLIGCLSFLAFLGLDSYFSTLVYKISLNEFFTSYDSAMLFKVSLILIVYLFILIELFRLKKEKKWYSIKNPNT
nr:hypothetical protein [uncultured Acetobacterium sp.]